MNKTEKKKSVKMEKQENVFKDLKKTFKRGQGLSTPPKPQTYGVNVNQKENNEAVPKKEKRSERISTYITREASDLLDDIIIYTKKQEGHKPKMAEVLERAIKYLHKNIIT